MATFPDDGSAVLEILAIDADNRIREAARRRLDATDDVLRPDRSA